MRNPGPRGLESNHVFCSTRWKMVLTCPGESQFSTRKEQSPSWIAALEDWALTHLGYKISGLGREPICTPRNENPHPCSLCVNLIYRLLFPPTPPYFK